ncbi:hypothetical protein C1J03_13300 [Sulfitobacter sp. SK012]|uniref:hypothetical protein n=1 Tax=Sulfitobacter sp. SK012 TaxID=1389005 RepID=UPI000E0A6A1B|nr:hypothetical protein [Sulfitobacter sp. SK012]AXI46912.1 hypothetical protein C1J03_13300 [Sulfitobacter sp. SK012]
MFGVVLWSDVEDRKAVFWCEDHGDLAFYQEVESPLINGDFFDAGDMVHFDVFVHQRLRKASNAHLVQEGACEGLPNDLRGTAVKEPPLTRPHHQASATVLPFVPPARMHADSENRLKA